MSDFQQYISHINPLTIGDLKKAIAGLSDDTQILVGIPVGTNLNSDWFNISQDIIRPDVNDEYSALTFTLADTYDSRQF